MLQYNESNDQAYTTIKLNLVDHRHVQGKTQKIRTDNNGHRPGKNNG